MTTQRPVFLGNQKTLYESLLRLRLGRIQLSIPMRMGTLGPKTVGGGQVWAPGHGQGRTAYLNLVKAGQCSSALPPKTSPVTAWSRGRSRICYLTQPLSGPMIPGRAFKLAAASVSLTVKWGCTAYPPGHHKDTMR